MRSLNSNIHLYVGKKLCLVVIILILLTLNAFAINSPGKTISGGSVKSNSNHFYLRGTIGQTPILATDGNALDINNGLWQIYKAIETGQCRPGEADNNGFYNILDIVYLINYKYKEGPSPIPNEFCSGDPNCDCSIDILDIVYLINFIYKEGLPPCSSAGWRTACVSR